MTQEEKAKAYDEALEKSKRLHEQGTITESLAYIFPELKESEDEKIKNEIIKFLELPHPQFVGKRHQEEWIAWLEKQGAKWGNEHAEIQIKAQSMALPHGCPNKEPASEGLEEAAWAYYDKNKPLIPHELDLHKEMISFFIAGAQWQKGKTLSDVKKALTGKVFQFSMENVKAWGDDFNGKTVTLKGRVTFHVSNPESIIDALIAELENDNKEIQTKLL